MELNNEEMQEQQEDTQHGRYLTFNVSDEVYGIEIEYVTEIISMQQVTKIPEIADYIKGIINLRGKIIPVIDVRLKFKKDSIEYNDRTCIIVVDTQEIIVGLIVDQVSEVMTIDDEDVAPPPNSKTGIRNRYIKGIGKIEGEVKLLLDCKKLFDENETQAIGAVSYTHLRAHET